MAVLYRRSSSPNFIDLTGSDEDDDNVEILIPKSVAEHYTPSKLPPMFSDAVQGTLLEAAGESTRRLAAAGNLLANVPGHGPSKRLSNSPRKRPNPNASTLVSGSPRRPVGILGNRHASPPSLRAAIASRTRSRRGPTLARTQTRIEGFFHNAGLPSEGQYGTNRGENSAGNIPEIRNREAFKKRHVAKERNEELELAGQINPSSLPNGENARFMGQIRGTVKKEPSTKGSRLRPGISKKAAVDFLRTQVFPHLLGIMDVFKEIKSPEERRQICMEAARKMVAKPYFTETLLNGNVTSSKARENEIKALVKASFDEAVTEKGWRTAMADSRVEQGSQRRDLGDGIELGLDAAEAIGTLDGLIDIDTSGSGRQLVDQTASFIIGSTPGRAVPPKRTADGVIKPASISRADASILPYLSGDPTVAALAATLPKVAQGNSRAGPKPTMLPKDTHPSCPLTVVSELETQRAKLSQPFAPRASSNNPQPPLFKDPTRSHIVKLSVGKARLLRFISEGSSSRSVIPLSRGRSASSSARRRIYPQRDGTKPQLVPSKASSKHTKGKSLPSTISQYTPNAALLSLTDAISIVRTKHTLPELGSSDIYRASKVLDELSTSLQHLSSLVRPPTLQSGSSNRPISADIQATDSHAKDIVPLTVLRHPAPLEPSSLKSVLPGKMNGRRSSRRILGRNVDQPSESAQHAARSPFRRDSAYPTMPSLAKGRLMTLVKSPKPFVSDCDRKLLEKGISNGWWGEGKVLHMDFSEEEMLKVLQGIEGASSVMTSDSTDGHPYATVIGGNSPAKAIGPDEAIETRLFPYAGFLEPPVREKIMILASKMVDADILSVGTRLINEGILPGRNAEDVFRFLKDAALECLTSSPSVIQVALMAPPVRRGDHVFSTSTDSLLRRREFGLGHARGGWHSSEAIESELRLRVYDTMKEWKSWTGGSSDTASVAWDATGEYFAVGFSALTDTYNMQYNRRNNLLLGDMWKNMLREFPDHRVPRPRTDHVNIVDDLFLYQTVSQVKFGANGKRMYSASFDRTVKIWDFAASDAHNRLLTSLHQGAEVDVMALSADEHLATGSKDDQATVKVWSIDEANPSSSKIYATFNSLRKGPAVYPSCMQWGQHSSVNQYLLVGFSGEDHGVSSRRGDIVLWDAESESRIFVSPAAQYTFDAVWHSDMAAFVVGCTLPGSESTRKSDRMRTCVRTYHPMNGGFKDDCELGCPAYDINDVTWSSDAIYVTASCTDGKIYVWDTRFAQADRGWLHILQHGEPIIPLPEGEPRERTDTGVRFTQWGPASDRLYTGSSDGIIKSWNVKRAAEDVLVADVANIRSIVMSGAFSPDSSRLLVGDGKGGIHVLSTGMDDDDSVERMEFEPAEKVEEDGFEGCEEADRLVASGEIIMRHGRPYQGPSYRSANERRQALREQLDLIYERMHENQDSFDYSALDFDHPSNAMEVDKSRHLESCDDYDLMDLS